MENSPQKNHCCQSSHQVDYLFLFNFVRLVDWQSSTGGLGQIWLQITEESRNFWVPHYIFATCYTFQSKFGDLTVVFLKIWRLWKKKFQEKAFV
jgi:hypothetical protein